MQAKGRRYEYREAAAMFEGNLPESISSWKVYSKAFRALSPFFRSHD